jgi:hypothetical protein
VLDAVHVDASANMVGLVDEVVAVWDFDHQGNQRDSHVIQAIKARNEGAWAVSGDIYLDAPTWLAPFLE